MRLTDQVAIVTGGAQGLGLAITKRLLAEGAKVDIWDIDPKILAKVEAELAAPERVRTTRVDVTSEPETHSAARASIAHWGSVQILVNNAGIGGPIAPTWEISLADWQRVIEVNLNGVFLCCKALVPHLREQGYGRIINIASMAGKEASPNINAYAASKHAVVGLTKTLGRELATDGITVNAIAPAAIETALTDAWPREHVANLLSKIPMGRFGKPHELAAMVAFIASEDASFNTGAVFDLSGGRANF